ncbi:hypothetical protein JKF63_01848 [Porcisia hertigi]|uniref:Cytosolic carboxypeptidase-like protein 5 n=1 Tax=Porcisia hertigi TaxID=2761500 RepID=A0A836L4B8_9TRYP|nr:hypothetical protein JKF63_01848 [Porcisia hertigi]
MPLERLVPVTESSNTAVTSKSPETAQTPSKKKSEQHYLQSTHTPSRKAAKGKADVQGGTYNDRIGTNAIVGKSNYSDFSVTLSDVPESGAPDGYSRGESSASKYPLPLNPQAARPQVASRRESNSSQPTALTRSRLSPSPLFSTPPKGSEGYARTRSSPSRSSSYVERRSPGLYPQWRVQLGGCDRALKLTTQQTQQLRSIPRVSSLKSVSPPNRVRVLPTHSTRSSTPSTRSSYPLTTPLSSPPQPSPFWRTASRQSSLPISRPEALSRGPSSSLLREQQITFRETSILSRSLSHPLRQREQQEPLLDSSFQAVGYSSSTNEARVTGMGLSYSGCVKESSPKEGSSQQSPAEGVHQTSRGTSSSLVKELPCKVSRQGADQTQRNVKGSQGVAAAATVQEPQVDDEHWVFQRPPNNQRTFYFEEDNLEFSSQFDSGNLIQVERLSALHYRMYTAMDCGNAPSQTNNRQWFHFSVRGGGKGVVVTITFVGMAHSNMFTYDWMPVMSVVPTRPQYTRIIGKAQVDVLETMPETPGYPLLVYKSVSRDDADSDGGGDDGDNNGDGGDVASSNGNPGGITFPISSFVKPPGPGKKKRGKKKNIAMNLTFSFKMEAEIPVTYTPPQGRLDSPAIYIASNHPYSYATLQRNLAMWEAVAKKSNATRVIGVQGLDRQALPEKTEQRDVTEPPTEDISAIEEFGDSDRSERCAEGVQNRSDTAATSNIYFHREVLCKSLEGRDVTMLTVSDHSHMMMEREPLISKEDGLPYSSALGQTERPFSFSNKQYVVLTARVHPGECPGSHLMHGCIDFLMNTTDSCAAALRHNFVFCIVPMLNPDGVVRGHSRVDANGIDLNRMYRNPSYKLHPAPYAVLALLHSLSTRVSLFIDMHAHANKRGTFFYGNSMDGPRQIENLLYAKLVSLNTPFLDFRSCNFSEANMFAMGKSGKRKDSSSRVVAFTEIGIVHSYTLETSHVMADALNPVLPLVSNSANPSSNAMTSPPPLMHTPVTFRDTGRAMLLALLDLKGLNPKSRLPFTQFHSTRGLALWLQRQLQIESAELLFEQSFKAHGKEVQSSTSDSGNAQLVAIMRSITAEEYPEKITIKNPRLLPRTTFSGVRSFLPLETATVLLLQTAPTGPPRSLLYSGSTGMASSAAAIVYASGKGGSGALRRGESHSTGGNSVPTAVPPVVIATRCRSRPNFIPDDTTVET